MSALTMRAASSLSATAPTTRALRTGASASAADAAAVKPTLRGVVFDMDGTLTVPNLDFGEMYRRCGVPLERDLLAEVAAMAPAEAAAAHAVIDEMEAEGRRTLRLMPGAVALCRWLRAHGQ